MSPRKGSELLGNEVQLTDEDQLRMLHKMMLIREFDLRAIAERTAGRIYGGVHPYVGQEAVAVGICSALRPSDRITSTHRGHGHCIAKGVDINAMMAELFGRVDGCCKGRGGSMHIADFSVGVLGANGIVAGGLPIAAGAALAAQLQGEQGVTACFFGDGAVGEGEFHEALNIASLWKLPLLFVCENNQYASNQAASDQRVVQDISINAAAYGMPGVAVDGNDVVAVHEAGSAAVTRARGGEGPTLIVCNTYRVLFHSMRAIVPSETRDADEIAEWKQRDPIGRYENRLIIKGVATANDVAALRARVARELEDAVAFAESSPFPSPADVRANVFA